MKVSTIVGDENIASVNGLLRLASNEGVVADWYNYDVDVRVVYHDSSHDVMTSVPSLTLEAHTPMGELYLDIVIAPYAKVE